MNAASEDPSGSPTRSTRAHKRGWAVRVLFGAVLVLTLWPLWPIGYTDHDSMYTAIRVWTEDSYLAWVGELARHHGRWHYYISYSVVAVAFLVKSTLYYKAVALGAIAASALVYAWAVRRITGSAALGHLTLLAYLLSLQVSANHSFLTGYLGPPQLIVVGVALSYALFWKYLTEQDRPGLMGALLCYAVALTQHETVILYSVGHGGLWLAATSPQWRWPTPRRAAPLYAVAATVAIYLAASFFYRAVHPTQYAGNAFSWEAFSVRGYLHTVYQFSLSALPGYNNFDDKFRMIFVHYATNPSGGPFDVLGVGWAVGLRWVLRAAGALALLVAAARMIRPLRGKHTGALLAAGVVLWFLPNALIGVSPHYQQLALSGARIAAHMTYFSTFGIALILATLAHLALQAKRARGAALLLLGGATVCVSFANDYANHYVSVMQSELRTRWDFVDALVETPAFQDIPNGSTILAPGLWKVAYNPYYRLANFSGAHLLPAREGEAGYWTKYFRARGGLDVTVVERLGDATALEAIDAAPVFYLRFLQDGVGDVPSAVLARLDAAYSENAPLVAEEFDLYYFDHDRPNYIHLVASDAPQADVTFDGTPAESDEPVISAPVARSGDRAALQRVHIAGAPAYLNSVRLSRSAHVDYIPEGLAPGAVPVDYVFSRAGVSFGTNVLASVDDFRRGDWRKRGDISIEANDASQASPVPLRRVQRLRSGPDSAVLQLDNMPVEPGDRARAAVWLWSDESVRIELEVGRGGDTELEGTSVALVLEPTPKLYEVEHAFERTHDAARFLIRVQTQADAAVWFAAAPELIRLPPVSLAVRGSAEP